MAGALLEAPTCGAKLQGSFRLVHTPRSAVTLLHEHRMRIKNGEVIKPRELPLTFEGFDPAVSLSTVYNPAGWFTINIDGRPQTIFAARRESLRSETDSEVGFFSLNASGQLSPFQPAGLEKIRLQDPFVAQIAGETVLGGVKLELDSKGRIKSYSTTFYRDLGLGLSSLTPAFEGPPGMKDIRLVELKDHHILAFTRPQGRRKGGRGQVGYTFFNRLDDLNQKAIQDAPLIKGQFLDEEWGGVNAAYLLKNGLVGVLGHIARFTPDGRRQYYVVAWAFNPMTGESTPMEIIFAREDLPEGLERGHKREDLKNVTFPAQLTRHSDGTATLTGGEGDRRCFSALITDPLAKFESIIF